MSLEIYLAYVAACILITIIPGPTVTLIIANSLTHGTRAGLLNVAGTQLGLLVMLGLLMVGLPRSSPRWACGSTMCGSQARSTWFGSAGSYCARMRASGMSAARRSRAADFCCRAFWC